MRISRLTIDKLGVKLYDRVSAVIAELVANSYDADATEVTVIAPMGEALAVKRGNDLLDKNYVIEVKDNGIGMTPAQVQNFYLIIGRDRRSDVRQGDRSPIFKRKVMGRKGVGKLAPFGICEQIEVISSGGDPVTIQNANGTSTQGYRTAHIILNQKDMMTDQDSDYIPQTGDLDETLQPEHGTIIRLRNFNHRIVPTINELERQLSQRFGIRSSNWSISLVDANKTSADPDYSREVGEFVVATMPQTRLIFEKVNEGEGVDSFITRNENGDIISDISAGFEIDGTFYGVVGWIGYSRDPYRDDLMAGVRIYCRGKIAAQTAIFNRKAGFTGEHSVRSYLVGTLDADWLDVSEDLIQTDRRDILWSHEVGRAFEEWGQKVVLRIGRMSREPLKKKTWDLFREISDLDHKTQQAFPGDDQATIREKALEIAHLIGQTIREDDLQDSDHVESLVQLSFLLAPHITLDAKLREAADSGDTPLGVITGILKTARIAELSSFGRIADDRVRVIQKIETLKDTPETLEMAFQSLITEAPWLINPQWSPIAANQQFATLRREFQKYYERETGIGLNLDDFSDPTKRVDFVLSTQDNALQLVEIKRPFHALANEEMGRIDEYIRLMDQFLNNEAHRQFRALFPQFHVTLVCDRLNLSGLAQSAFEGFVQRGVLTHIDWATFLLNTRKMHEDFLLEAERQRRYASSVTNGS